MIASGRSSGYIHITVITADDMDAFPFLKSLEYITWWEALLRMVIALVFGFILGWERDSKNKPINFRAYMIVAVTACGTAILGQELNNEFNGSDGIINIDLGKIISGTLTGIGFLGAGAIIKVENQKIVGSATGASIWASGGIGLILGFGYYDLALISIGVVAAILIMGGYFMGTQGYEDKETLEHDEP